MYKVLVVHQNEEKMDLICKAINSTKNDTELIRVTSSENDLEIVEKEKPDIVFMAIDSDMGIDGIEMATCIKKMDFCAHVVFISGFDDFDMIRKALQIGVVYDFLLAERITEHDIVETVNNLFAIIDCERKKKKKEEEKEKFIEDYYNLTGYSFVYSVLFNGKMTKDIGHYKKMLNLSDFGFWINIEFENKVNNVNLDKIDIHEELRNILRGYCKFIIGPRMLNRIVVYISADDHNEEIQKKYAKEISKKIVVGLENKYNVNVLIGIGSLQSLEKLQVSYEEALKCLRKEKENQIVDISEISRNYVSDHKNYMEYEKKILEAIDMARQDVDEIFLEFLNFISDFPIEEKRNKVLEILVLSCYAVNKHGINECNDTDYSKFYEEFAKIDDIDIESWALNKFQFISKSIRDEKTGQLSDTVKKAVFYIREHYNENISLNDIAEVVGVSLQYFSKIFKVEMGKNYVEWVNELRIERAKELMKDKKLTIKEVCFRVGYNDPNYFSRIFKKYEGISPKKFIECLTKN